MWNMVAAAGLGGLAGLTAPKPYGGKQFDLSTDQGQRKGFASGAMDFLGGAMRGDKPLVSQASINQMLSGSNARLEGTANAARARAQERSIGRGEVGNRGGMLEASLSGIDRSLLDAKRQQAAPLMGQLAMQQPQYRLQAAQQGLGFLQGQEQMALGEHGRMEGLRAGQAAYGSGLSRFLGGAAAGMSSMGGFPGMGGGGGGRMGGGDAGVPGSGGRRGWGHLGYYKGRG